MTRKIAIRIQRISPSGGAIVVRAVPYDGDANVARVSDGQIKKYRRTDKPVVVRSQEVYANKVRVSEDAAALANMRDPAVAAVRKELEELTARVNSLPVGGDGSGYGVGIETFTGQTIVTVTHYRGYRPLVEVTDQTGDEVDADVNHSSLNQFVVYFNVPQSGRITYL